MCYSFNRANMQRNAHSRYFSQWMLHLFFFLFFFVSAYHLVDHAKCTVRKTSIAKEVWKCHPSLKLLYTIHCIFWYFSWVRVLKKNIMHRKYCKSFHQKYLRSAYAIVNYPFPYMIYCFLVTQSRSIDNEFTCSLVFG